MARILPRILLIGLLSSPATLFGQLLLPQKDVAFAQVAVGPNIITVITLTNRGDFQGGFVGTLIFSRGLEGAVWNPKVNGTTITNGEFPVTVLIDETVVLTISGDSAVETGFVLLQAEDLVLDNFVEANLTYYVRENGQVVDSIGVPPSQEFYLAAVPFEGFADIGLALANPSFDGEPVTVIITAIDGVDGQVYPGVELQLGPLAHTAQFLTEIFPDISMGRGKVEIASSLPIIGTALTLVNGEISSLPLLPSPVAYTLTMITEAETRYEGSLALWAEGYFVKGYLVVASVNGEEIANAFVTLVNGQLVDGFLDLSFFAESRYLDGNTGGNRLMTIYMGDPAFSFSFSDATGEFIFTYLEDGTTERGAYSLVRTTP